MPYTQSILQTELSKQHDTSAGWPWHLLTLSFVIALTVSIVYVGMRFGFEEMYLKRALSHEESVFATTVKSVSPNEQTSVFNFYSQLSNIETLLQKQGKATPFLTSIEQQTLKEVVYTGIDLRIASPATVIIITGKTAAYPSVVQQLERYKQIPNVTDVKLLGARFISPAEGVNFSVQITIGH